MRALLAVAYIVSVVAGVWAVGDPKDPTLVPVAPGMMAPVAVYFVGLTLVIRDLLHRRLSGQARKPVLFALIATGATISAVFSPAIAVASAAAFALSETVDYIVFALTERFGFLRAVVTSNAVSLIVDSVVFLSIAFEGGLAFLPGQILGKALATLAAVLVLWVIRSRRMVTA